VAVGPSGIAEREDIVMLGLGGSKEEVDEEGDPDIELMDERLVFECGMSGDPPPTPGGSLDDRRAVPVRLAAYAWSPRGYGRLSLLFRIIEVMDSEPEAPEARSDSAPDVAWDSAPESL
jgi:hypothetical protein